MKAIYKALALTLVLVSGFTSCNSFLDVVPDERTKEEDTYADRDKAIRYLYSCYAYLPNAASTPGGLDLLTGDEVVTPFEHETFAGFPKGKYTSSNTVISYWNSLFRGIRQCYMFLDVIDKINPDETTEAEKADYKAQVRFLIAYYHYELIRSYGPVTLVKETPNINMKPGDYPGRSPYDECVNWVVEQFDEAAKGLPARRDGTGDTNRPLSERKHFGLATSTAAKAFKAKLLVYAASPLFNGNPMYADFKDREGNQLMPMSYDPQKWVRAKVAVKEAIDAAEAAGYALYMTDDWKIADNKWPLKGPERRVRTLLVDWDTPHTEVIFADTRGPGFYDVPFKSTPRSGDQAEAGSTGICPTWAMLNRFYTKNGLPWDEDPEFKNLDKFEIVAIGDEYADQAVKGKKTIRFNLDREPRFRAWIAFQGGYYEIKALNDQVYNPARGYRNPGENGRVIMDFTFRGNQGRQAHGTSPRPNNYTPGGYLNKKACSPAIVKDREYPPHERFPWSVMRLADLYLLYAEAAVETNELGEAKSYLNRVRTRAGIPTVEDSWALAGVALDQNKLRQIVRQERQVEFYLENQNFWDMRRWLLAGDAFDKKPEGMNILGVTEDEFFKLTTIDVERAFDKKAHYLLPIPLEDINKVPKLVNNPGY